MDQTQPTSTLTLTQNIYVVGHLTKNLPSSQGCSWPSQGGFCKREELDSSERAGQLLFTLYHHDLIIRIIVIIMLTMLDTGWSQRLSQPRPHLQCSLQPGEPVRTIATLKIIISAIIKIIIVNITMSVTGMMIMIIIIINQQRLCSGTITMRCTPRLWTHTQWLPRIGCSTTPENWRWWLLMLAQEVWLQTWRKQKGLLAAPDL